MSRHYNRFTVSESPGKFSVEFKHPTKNKPIKMSFPKKGMNEGTPDKVHKKAEIDLVCQIVAKILDLAFP